MSVPVPGEPARSRAGVPVGAFVLLTVLAAPVRAFPPPEAREPFARDIVIAAGQEATRDIVSIGGHIRVDGTARRDVVGIGGSIEVNGTVAGSVVAVGSPLRLGEKTVVQGDVICVGGQIDRANGARIDGEAVYLNTPSELMDRLAQGIASAPFRIDWEPIVIGIRLVTLFTWFLVSACVVLAFPRQIRFTAGEMPQHFGRFLLIGVLWTISLLVLAILFALLCLLVIGIPLLLLLIVFAFLIKIFGNVSIYYFFGQRILNALGRSGGPDILAVVAGLALVGLVEFIPVVGWVFWTLLGIMGMGATLATRFGTGTPWFSRA